MKILVIDNGTSYLEALKEQLKEHTVEVAPYSARYSNYGSFDAIILSGGYSFPVTENEDKVKLEMDLIRQVEKPILGIGFGFELIAHLYGSKLAKMDKKEQGFLDVDVLDSADLFKGISHFQVFENHRWIVRALSGSLVPLARSQDGIEAFRHSSRSIYAIQFSPEMFLEKTCWKKVFKNFLDLAI